jgi:2-polyprenyl-6-methoxyphenol hydroxylase-like FAD-dependent oxidoreductase
MADADVLVVGAGPTGLILALFLTKLGVRVRIIDKIDAPGKTSRALVVHARTLEFYRQIGIADDALDGGIEFKVLNLWVRARRVGRVPFGDLGTGLSPYPYMLVYPQDRHERMLIDKLRHVNVEVERQCELVSFEGDGGGVRAQLRTADGSTETCAVRYLAGCDGAHSTVREKLAVGFPGGTYSHVFYVADVAAEGQTVNGELHIALDEADFVAVFPLRDSGAVRLVGSVGNFEAAEQLQWNDVSKSIIDRLQLKVKEVHWFSTYRVHHRVASAFRRGSAFLLGDAAHIHSPVGGQGMNTGIGDAVNLAWKLAAVLQGRIDASVLDTYEKERIGFANRLVNTTDRVFQLASSDGVIAKRVRLYLIPLLLPQLFRISAVKRYLFRTISQIGIEYPDSPLSEGKKGGERLPWIPDNFAPLQSLDWQVHVYGEASQEVRAVCEKRGIALHVYPANRDAVYLVRPDGYIGMADGELERYLDKWRILSRGETRSRP